MSSRDLSLIRRRFLPGCILLGGIAGWASLVPRRGEAQSVLRRRPELDALRRSQWRRLYRPGIRIVRPSGGTKTFRVGQSLPYAFSSQRGFVTRIEVRSGLEVIKRIHVGQARRGRGTITITHRDLATVGKEGRKIGFTLWAWQGQPAYQSVHGESIRYRLLP